MEKGIDAGRFAGIGLEQRSELPSHAGFLLVVTGPSSVGKTEVVKRLVDSQLGFKSLVTLTTRRKRDIEEDGIDYYFVDREEFMFEKNAGNLVEDVKYPGNLYGTPKSEMDRLLDGINLISVMEMSGAAELKNNIKKAYNPQMAEAISERLILVTLGVSRPREIIERANKRSKVDRSSIKERFRKDVSLWRKYKEVLKNTIILNDDGKFEIAVSQIEGIVKSRKSLLLPDQELKLT